MSDRPNVVVILTDQQTADAMSCAGNPDVATPAMDALAATGVRFTRAYCTQPLCTPSRDVGKWHVPTQVDESTGFSTRVQVLPDNDLAEASTDFINTQREDPFLLVTSFNEPHGICEWARRQPPPSRRIPEPPADAWPALPMNYQPSSYDAELPRLARDRMPHTHPIAGWTEDDWRRYRHAYYRLCERVDASLGRMLTALEAGGQRENTLIVFSSDHGDGLGAHQWNQKWILTEESARLPLIVAPPTVTNPVGHAAVDDRLVSVGLDLLPTVCDYAGITTPSGLCGRSLRPWSKDGTTPRGAAT